MEAWLIGLAILFVLSRQVGVVASAVLSNGLLFLCGTCGMWAVLRIRVPQGRWLRQALWEGAVGLSLGLVMAIGLQVPARWLGWEEVWLQTREPLSSRAELVILQLGGQVLYQAEAAKLSRGSDSWRIDLSMFPSGTYICQIKEQGRVIISEKLVIIK